MSRRIEIELTSSRDDGTWTWRAAGAREPRGTVSTDVLGNSPKVGDVLRVDAEFFIDGIEITGVVPDRDPRREAERLELLGSGRPDEQLVTTTLAKGNRDGRGDRRERKPRDRDRRDGRGGERGSRRDGGGGSGEGRQRRDRDSRDRDSRDRDSPDRDGREQRRSRSSRPEAPPLPVVERPKTKRLRAGKAHRNALLESLPEEQRPVAEQVVMGGLPAVRQAIEKQNTERAAAGESAIAPGPLLELAEKLVPKVRAAEWRDRAEAAQRDLEVLDLRDLRSVVSAAEGVARDKESRELARELREGLTARVDAEHATWLEELTAVLEVGRVVRALRISSRPPKAGAPLPPELATKLIEGATAALTDDAAPERWVAVLEALAFAPVRDRVIPESLPDKVHDDVKATIARNAGRLPKIAHIFEIEPDRSAPRPERRRPQRPKKPKKSAGKPRANADPQDQPAPKVEEPAAAAEEKPESTEHTPGSTEAGTATEETPHGTDPTQGAGERPGDGATDATPPPASPPEQAPDSAAGP